MISNLKEVPQNWIKVRFDEIAEIVKDRIENPSDSGLEYFIGLEHLDTDCIRIKRFGSAEDVKSSKFICKKGDIIFGRRRTYLRKLAISDRDAVVSTDAMIFRPIGDKIYPDFLPCFMQSSIFWKTVHANSEGSMSPRIKWKTLAKQEFWVPTIEEQKKMSQVLWSIEENRNKIEQLIQFSEQFRVEMLDELLRKGFFNNKFKRTDLIEIPEKWTLYNLKEILKLLKDGTHLLPKKQLAGIPILSAININGGTIDFNKKYSFISQQDFDKIHKNYSIEYGDVLYTIVGTIGRTAIVSTKDIFTIQRSVAILKPDYTKVTSEFLCYLIQSSIFSEQIKQRTKTTAQPGIYLKELGSVLVAIPPLDEQKMIAKMLKMLDLNIKKKNIHLMTVSSFKKKLIDEFISGKLIIPKEAL